MAYIAYLFKFSLWTLNSKGIDKIITIIIAFNYTYISIIHSFKTYIQFNWKILNLNQIISFAILVDGVFCSFLVNWLNNFSLHFLGSTTSRPFVSCLDFLAQFKIYHIIFKSSIMVYMVDPYNTAPISQSRIVSQLKNWDKSFKFKKQITDMGRDDCWQGSAALDMKISRCQR